jgi:environmental stress-induced protein Ves
MAHDLLSFATRPPSRWANGAGRKADIATGRDWMVGFAWLDADAPFSDFSGQNRIITLLDGPGFTLDFAPPNPPLVVTSRHVPSPFDGGWPTQCRILGPCLVLNAMCARDRWRHSVTVVTEPTSIPPAPINAFGFLVDLTTRDARRLDGAIDTTALPAAYILFRPVA